MRISTLVAALTISAVPTFSAAAGESLTKADLDTLQRELRPSDSERWRTIPWRISLLEAQHVATREKKPIFIWAMDGHPLGCT